MELRVFDAITGLSRQGIVVCRFDTGNDTVSTRCRDDTVTVRERYRLCTQTQDNITRNSACGADLPLVVDDDIDLDPGNQSMQELDSDDDNDDMIASFQRLLHSGGRDERHLRQSLQVWDKEWRVKWTT